MSIRSCSIATLGFAVLPAAAVAITTGVPDEEALAATGLTSGTVMAEPVREVIAPLAELAAAGTLKVDVVIAD